MLTLLLVLCLRFVSGPISDLGVEDRMLAAGRHGDDRAATHVHAQPLQSALNESKSAHDTMEPPALPTMVSAEIGPAGQEYRALFDSPETVASINCVSRPRGSGARNFSGDRELVCLRYVPHQQR